MALKVPKSMDECLYFTNRLLDNGQLLAWVYRKDCPKCKATKMGKPVDAKTGKVKSRSTEYVCSECGFTEQKNEHEESLTLEAKYTCPNCGKEGESTAPYKRKKYLGVDSYVVECQHCKEIIPLTKKLKEIKKKKK